MDVKVLVIAFVVVVLAALGAMLALSHSRSAAPGEIATETRTVTGFHRIEVNGELDLTLVQGAEESVIVEAPVRSMRRIQTEVRDGTLFIDAAPQRRGWGWLMGRGNAKAARLTVNLRELDEIEAAGAVNVAAGSLKANELHLDFAGASKLRIGDLQAVQLRLDAAGATKADIRGKVARQQVDLSGAGSYDAGQLVSDDARVDVSGAGKALVNVRKTLRVDIAGAGKVEYIGDPELRQSVSGVGKVSKREAS